MTHAFVLRLGGIMVASALAIASAPAEAEPSVLVTTTTLQKGTLPQTITAYGRVEAATEAQQTVMSPLSAVVDEIYVRLGEDVVKGAPLIRLIPSPTAAASYAQAKSALHVATQLVVRTRKMVGQHLATAQQLADAEKSESDARAVLTALTDQGAAGPNVIHAPFHALVTAISTSRGAIVAEGASLLDLAQPEGLILRVGVLPAQATSVRPGDSVLVRFIGSKKSLSGTVMLRGSIVDMTSGLVPIEIALPVGQCLPGQMAAAVITVGEIAGYVVPHRAILTNDDGKPYLVQVVKQIARKVPVEVLGADGDRDVVTGALDPAASLVLDGAYQLEDGMKVRSSTRSAKASQ